MIFIFLAIERLCRGAWRVQTGGVLGLVGHWSGSVLGSVRGSCFEGDG